MRVLKAVGGALGVLAVAGAVVVAGDPAMDLAEPAVEALGNDYLVVAVPAVIAILVVVLGLLFRAASGLSQASPPDPEGVPSVPAFGSEFDEFVSGTPGRSHLWGDAPERMHERVREAAIRTEMRVDGVTREVATDRVDDGSWTDDEDAAAFCRPNGTARNTSQSRLRAAFRGKTWSQYGAARAAESVVVRSDAATRRAVLNDGGRSPREDDR